MMHLDVYQQVAATYAIYPERSLVTYPMLGLTSEVGELAGKMKKMMRDGGDPDVYLRSMRSELGDVLWYVAQLATDLGFNFDDIAEENLAKLYDRKERDQIKGSGDDR